MATSYSISYWRESKVNCMTLRMIPRKARPFFQVKKNYLFIETSPETLPIPFEGVEGEADDLHEF